MDVFCTLADQQQIYKAEVQTYSLQNTYRHKFNRVKCDAISRSTANSKMVSTFHSSEELRNHYTVYFGNRVVLQTAAHQTRYVFLSSFERPFPCVCTNLASRAIVITGRQGNNFIQRQTEEYKY